MHQIIEHKMQKDPMTPYFLPMQNKRKEILDVISFDLLPQDQKVPWSNFLPGQFNMLYVFGVGEIPISISGSPENNDIITHTVRAVGPVSRALANLDEGEPVGLRGPFGSHWPIEEAQNKDIVIIAGGLGIAPLRPLIYHVINSRTSFESVSIIYGTRSPETIIFSDELISWRNKNIQVEITVDSASKSWTGNVGVVTDLLSKIQFDPDKTLAFLCGPEVMMRYGAKSLIEKNVMPNQIFISMERNMKCGIASCGHCQFGPTFICREGPVYRFNKIQQLLNIREV